MPADPTDETHLGPAAGAPAVAARAVLGERYEILGLLGAGGMGNVYRARDLELDELVALKVLRPELVGTPGVLERFRREVKLARRITHPNVARVFDIGERGGEKILTMELIDGESLAALLARERRLSIGRVVEIASAICAGLGAAHAAGVIHRDLKPDNVLLEKGGRVVLTDFGIARAVSLGAGDAAATGTAFLGTPAYMAPEQVEAGAAIDARADLYALGAMLYELVTGERPWQGDHVLAVAVARLLHPPPDPRARRAELPAALAATVLRCMARRPGDRFGSAAEVASALSAVILPAPFAGPAPASLPPSARGDTEAAPGRGDKRVAVLPFRNAGPAEHDYLADGLTEDLIDQLSMAPGLQVRSRGVVMRHRGTERDPRELGRELDVQVVVEGTLRRAAGGVRISARLVSVADGVQLWARRFDRPDAELLSVSDDTARAIAEALTVELRAPERGREGDAEATDLYLQARAAYHRFFDDVFGGDSIRLFERALARAPDDPRILAGFAMARARHWRPDPAVARLAREAAERAATIAPGSSLAHLSLGAVRFQTGEELAAVPALRRALRLSPGNGEAHDLLGRILSETRLLSDAQRHLVTAFTLEPDLIQARLTVTRTAELLGDHEEADRIIDEHEARLLPLVGRILMWRRDAGRAAELLASTPKTNPTLRLARGFFALVAHGTPPYELFAGIGGHERASPRLRSFFAQLESEAAAFLGDGPRALTALERACELGILDVAWMDRLPLFGALRGEPRFLAVHEVVAARAERVAEAYLAPEGA